MRKLALAAALLFYSPSPLHAYIHLFNKNTQAAAAHRFAFYRHRGHWGVLQNSLWAACVKKWRDCDKNFHHNAAIARESECFSLTLVLLTPACAHAARSYVRCERTQARANGEKRGQAPAAAPTTQNLSFCPKRLININVISRLRVFATYVYSSCMPG